jgi:hypothetical protein
MSDLLDVRRLRVKIISANHLNPATGYIRKNAGTETTWLPNGDDLVCPSTHRHGCLQSG